MKGSRQAKRQAKRQQKKRQTRRQAKRQAAKSRKQRGAGLSDAFPVTTWGSWTNMPGSTLWGPGQQAPPPLANGGLYMSPQSTGAWASQPMPATQYAFAAEAAKVAGNPEVFYQQRPITQPGTSWSPWVGQTISQDHWSARLPYGVSNDSK